VTTVERCKHTDLPIGQCGDVCCRPDLEPSVPDVLPLAVPGTWCEAQYPGTCGCGCETRFAAGTEIALADEGYDRWCLVEHTRTADS